MNRFKIISIMIFLVGLTYSTTKGLDCETREVKLTNVLKRQFSCLIPLNATVLDLMRQVATKHRISPNEVKLTLGDKMLSPTDLIADCIPEGEIVTFAQKDLDIPLNRKECCTLRSGDMPYFEACYGYTSEIVGITLFNDPDMRISSELMKSTSNSARVISTLLDAKNEKTWTIAQSLDTETNQYVIDFCGVKTGICFSFRMMNGGALHSKISPLLKLELSDNEDYVYRGSTHDLFKLCFTEWLPSEPMFTTEIV